jgi:uncharacterized protein YbjT (DUF2867 family)
MLHLTRLLSLVTLGLVTALAAAPPAMAEDTGLVLVAGATGRTGQHVVEQLLARGQPVRVLARDEARAREIFGDRVQVAIGDIRSPDGLAAAMTGVRYVVSTTGSTQRTDPTNTPEAVDYRGIRNLVDGALAAGGVQHFVLLTSMGITQLTHPLNRAGNNVLIWKGLGENAVRFSGIPYTIVRPGGLNDEPGGQVGIRAGQGDSMAQNFIPREDVAAVCVNAIGNPDAVNKTLEIVGDPASSGVNWEAFFKPLKADEQPRMQF